MKVLVFNIISFKSILYQFRGSNKVTFHPSLMFPYHDLKIIEHSTLNSLQFRSLLKRARIIEQVQLKYPWKDFSLLSLPSLNFVSSLYFWGGLHWIITSAVEKWTKVLPVQTPFGGFLMWHAVEVMMISEWCKCRIWKNHSGIKLFQSSDTLCLSSVTQQLYLFYFYCWFKVAQIYRGTVVFKNCQTVFQGGSSILYSHWFSKSIKIGGQMRTTEKIQIKHVKTTRLG